METYNVSVSKYSYRQKLIQQVIPAICARVPLPLAGGRATIQQDNALPHIEPIDAQFCQATAAAARDIALHFQPPNSSDLNCCNLRIFIAIEARQRLRQTKTIDELIAATEAASCHPLPLMHVQGRSGRPKIDHSKELKRLRSIP